MSDRESANITKEKMTVLYVKPGEKPKRIEIENDLEALQRAVGGYIEAVYPYEDPVALIVNEEGKLNGLLLNPMLASAAMAFSSVSVVLNSLSLGRRSL